MNNHRTYQKVIVPIFLIIAVFLFLFFELSSSLVSPDIDADEATIACRALMIKNNVHTPGDFDFLGRHFVLTNFDHKHGALEAYFIFPFIQMMGVTLQAVRIPYMILGILILFLTFLVGRELIDPLAGSSAALLLSLNTGFLQIIKIGGHIGASILFFLLSSLLFFKKYHDTKNMFSFLLGTFLLGLGMNVKGFFIWLVLPVACYGLAIYIPRYKIKLGTLIGGLFSFLLGALPLVYSYVQTGAVKWFLMQKRYIITPTYKINNVKILQNVWIRLGQLQDMLAGGFFGTIKGVHIFPGIIFWFCFCYLLLWVVFKKKNFYRRGSVIFLLFVFTGTLISTAFTFTGHWKIHMYVMFSYVPLIVAAFFWLLLKTKPNALKNISVFLCAGFLLVGSGGLYAQRYREKKVEMKREKDVSVEALTNFLKGYSPVHIVCTDRSVAFGIYFFSDLTLEFISDLFMDEDRYFSEKNIDRIIQRSGKEAIYIVGSPDHNRKKYASFQGAAVRLNKKVFELKKFVAHNNDTRFIVFRIK